MSSTREQILLTTCELLENQGFNATGLNEIVQKSGAPKGSIYYHFPEGKDEIVSEAVKFAGQRVAERIQTRLADNDNAAEAIRVFIEAIAHQVEASGFRAGGPLTIVASESATTNDRINRVCQEAYAMLMEAFAEKLSQVGLDQKKSVDLALTITAAIEGAIILSRTYHSGDPLRQVASAMAGMIQNCK
jgi:TetR/AcrR family transcriptional repressor of lmrAB and yxaGH operons